MLAQLVHLLVVFWILILWGLWMWFGRGFTLWWTVLCCLFWALVRVTIDRYERSIKLGSPPADNDAEPITLFAHGLGSSPFAALQWTNEPLLDTPVTVWTWIWFVLYSLISLRARVPCLHRVVGVPIKWWPFKRYWNIGEEGNVHDFVAFFLADMERRPATTPYIFVGHSRGAATVFNAVVLLAKRPDWPERIRPRLRSVICCMPFATVRGVMIHRWGQWVADWLQPLLDKYTQHDAQESWAPLNRAHEYPLDGPFLLLVGSRGDRSVPSAFAANELGRILTAHAKEKGIRDALAVVHTFNNLGHDLPTTDDPDALELGKMIRQACNRTETSILTVPNVAT